MYKDLTLELAPEQAANPEIIQAEVSKVLRIPEKDISEVRIQKQSLDARRKNIKVRLQLHVYLQPEIPPKRNWDFNWQNVKNAQPVIIIGFGPAGMFAALKLIELGFKPIIIERGKPVKERRRDLADINKLGIVNPDSNYCFGEGGAGTYSDGKLYTRSTKRGDIHRILQIFYTHGAPENILYEAHPHIGTNKLPGIVEAIRKTILECGGEIHFEKAFSDIILEAGYVKKIVLADGTTIPAQAVILCTGHSARDVLEVLHHRKIELLPKPFALGVRIEHPQTLIDSLQYGQPNRGEYLPPASYSLVTQVEGKGVFSFCMCPGGIIAPAATGPNEIVVNGWSPSKRNNPYANSGLVTTVDVPDFVQFKDKGVLAGLAFQADIEQKSFVAGGGNLKAPAQRVTDFIRNKESTSLPKNSYIPGTTPSSMTSILPKNISKSIWQALKDFDKKMRGYITEDAILVATESRTSCPVRIPRDKETYMHPQVEGLFPCGEGAGFAGGIVSAAIDGELCAAAAVAFILK